MEKEMDLLRRQLYNLVKENADFQEIYDVSVQLDNLIVVYYKEQKIVAAEEGRCAV